MDLSLGDTRLIINTCKEHDVLRNQAAYILSTAYHETAHTMKPIYERGTRSYFDKYEPGTHIGSVLGNTTPGDGYLFRGRGYVQLTGRGNYAKAAKKTGLDLVRLPDLALVPANAALIMVLGMVEGWFTGKKLDDYITLSASDFINARRIINGTDRAALIAGYAQQYDAQLQSEGYGTITAPPQPPEPTIPVPVPATVQPSVAASLPAAPAENATVTIADGPKKDETVVVVAKTPPPPETPSKAPSKTGIISIAAMIIAIIVGFLKHFGG